MAMQFGHKRLAKTHDFVVRLTFWVEVSTALAASHGQTSQAVLEGLLETEELEHAQGYRRVETDATFIRANRIVELHPVATINTYIAVIILPAYPEQYCTIWLCHSF